MRSAVVSKLKFRSGRRLDSRHLRLLIFPHVPRFSFSCRGSLKFQFTRSESQISKLRDFLNILYSSKSIFDGFVLHFHSIRCRTSSRFHTFGLFRVTFCVDSLMNSEGATFFVSFSSLANTPAHPDGFHVIH